MSCMHDKDLMRIPIDGPFLNVKYRMVVAVAEAIIEVIIKPTIKRTKALNI